MKTLILAIVFAIGLLAMGACAAMTSPAPAPLPASPLASPLAGPADAAPGGESPLMPVDATPSITVTAMPTGSPSVTPVITPTVVITASPTITQVAPTEPPAPEEPAPEETDTPAPTTPEPEPTETPTPEPPTPTPTVTPTEGPSPTPTSLPNAVFVRDHRSVRQGSDMLVVGEVANGSGNPVYNVTVSAAFFDQGGKLIGAQEALAFLPQTLPTQNNPFKIVLANAPESVSTYELALRWDELTAQGFDRITIVSEEAETEPSVSVRGDLRNDGFSPMSNIAVAATFYDAAGHVLDAYPGSVATAALDPGVVTTYSVETRRSDLDFDRVLVQAQGVLGR